MKNIFHTIEQEEKDQASKKREIRIRNLQQEEQCNNLRIALEEIRKARQTKEMESQNALAKEEWRKKHLELLNEEKKLVRQQAAKARLREFRRKQDEKLSEERLLLGEELRQESRRKREKALQNFIRTNFRRVVAEKRKQESGLCFQTVCTANLE